MSRDRYHDSKSWVMSRTANTRSIDVRLGYGTLKSLVNLTYPDKANLEHDPKSFLLTPNRRMGFINPL